LRFELRQHPRQVAAILAPVAAALLLGACDSPAAPPQLDVVSVAVTEPAPLAARLDVVLRSAAPLTVDYWTDGGPRLRIHSASAVNHSLPLVRLRAGRLYHYEIQDTDVTGTLVTSALPDDLAGVTFEAAGAPTLELVLVHLFSAAGFKGYAVVDVAGEVVWYWRTVDFPFGATRRDGGNFVFMDKGRGLVEVEPTGSVVRELAQDVAGRELHHDVIATPWNTILFLAFDDRPFEDRTLRGEAIWEWTPESGADVRRWTSWDHLDPDVDRGPRFGGEWLHANSLAVGARDNVLVSLHYLNQVISIAPDWNSLEWRLGGVNATIAVPAHAQFSGQHTARELAAERVILFDNGVDRGHDSRALELDWSSGSAEVAWEWAPVPPNFSTAVSSARRLPNGNTLVGFGLAQGIGGSTGPTEFYEVGPGGETLWRMEVGNVVVMFRAEPLTSIAGEVVVGQP
jgi:hypothetical protein